MKLNKEDSNYLKILGVSCLLEYNHLTKMWEGWLKDDSSIVHCDKNPEEVYHCLYQDIKYGPI